MKKTIARIAREHLNIASLTTSGSDRSDFKEVGLASLKDALEAAYRAGQASATQPADKPRQTPATLAHTGKAETFAINSIERRCASIGGAWVNGVCRGHAFSALVFEEHPTTAGHELGGTRITKLHMRRINDGNEAYSWDHGVEIEPKNKAAASARMTIAGDLANRVFNHGR